MKKSIAAGIGVLTVTLAFAAKDPVIMKINGVDVPRSEFEYLYNKNLQQQVNPQTIDDYVDMFTLYKLKVEDAKAEGLDTLTSFRKEMDQYRHDLAVPYLTDSTFINKLVDESYSHQTREVEARHIMLFKTRDQKKNYEIRQRIDSIKHLLDAGGNFEELAKQFSQDKGSASKGGYMGYIPGNMYPYNFEKTAYDLSDGEISDVVESPMGYHILKGGKSRPARGKVKVSHILRVTRGDESRKLRAKALIDSLYQVLQNNPSAFAELAKNYSEDPGSSVKGGELPWFGAGEMVAEFDSVAFAMAKGTISEPVETDFGYHIIYKADSRGVPSLATVRNSLIAKMTSPQDDRNKLIHENQIAGLAAKSNSKIDDKTLSTMRAYIAQNGVDSTFIADWAQGAESGMPLLTVNGNTYTVGDFMRQYSYFSTGIPALDDTNLMQSLDNYFSGLVMADAENILMQTEPPYRNLLKEYIDGSLLYEVSVRKVWDKAAKDTEGLENYFNTHRQDYVWQEPHVKGVFVQTVNDSIAGLIKKRAAELQPEQLVDSLRKEFKGQIAIEKILIAKGANAMVDHAVFGGPRVESSSANYKVYFMLNPKMLDAPEEVNDVKGQVTSDYQNLFQARWEDELREKYPVIVYDKVLKTVGKK